LRALKCTEVGHENVSILIAALTESGRPIQFLIATGLEIKV